MQDKIPDIVGLYQDDFPSFEKPSFISRILAPARERLFYKVCAELVGGSFSKAEVTLSDLTQQYPDFQDARFLYAAMKIRKQQWNVAQPIIHSLTGSSYFIGYWIFRFLPSFRLVMKVDDDFWLPILARTEEILIALALLRRYQGDEASFQSIITKAYGKFPDHVGLQIIHSSNLIKQGNPWDACKLMNRNLGSRQDDIAVVYRYIRGLALYESGDIRSGIYQMESGLGLAGYASPYLKENIKFRIIMMLLDKNFYVEAREHLEFLDPSNATNIPDGFNADELKRKISHKIETYVERDLDVRLSMKDRKPKQINEEDFWEV